MDEMLARRGQVAGHVVGPRFPALGRRTAPLSEDGTVKRDWNLFPSRIMGRASDEDCSNSSSNNTCEKPMGSSVATEITVGIL